MAHGFPVVLSPPPRRVRCGPGLWIKAVAVTLVPATLAVGLLIGFPIQVWLDRQLQTRGRMATATVVAQEMRRNKYGEPLLSSTFTYTVGGRTWRKTVSTYEYDLGEQTSMRYTPVWPGHAVLAERESKPWNAQLGLRCLVTGGVGLVALLAALGGWEEILGLRMRLLRSGVVSNGTLVSTLDKHGQEGLSVAYQGPGGTRHTLAIPAAQYRSLQRLLGEACRAGMSLPVLCLPTNPREALPLALALRGATPDRPGASSGFCLEPHSNPLILGAVVVGLLAVVLAYLITPQSPRIPWPAEVDAAYRRAKRDVQRLNDQVSRYLRTSDHRPDSLREALGHAVPRDPWGKRYRLAIERAATGTVQRGCFSVYSYGSDGKPGGELSAFDVQEWRPLPGAKCAHRPPLRTRHRNAAAP
jgi:hypothetical protein